jgi:hypothetical protein
MRTHGFGTMAELVRDIVYQNIESAGVKASGKDQILKLSLRLLQSSFCFAVRVVVEIY